LINEFPREEERKSMEPEFVINEEPLMNMAHLRDTIIAAIQREYDIRQTLGEMNANYKQELFGVAELLRELISTKESRCDKLIEIEQERAKQAEADGADPSVRVEGAKWLKRLEMIQRAFGTILEKYGVTRYVPSGKALPNRDDIKATVPNTGQESGTIIEVIRPGYLWRGELLRSAEVLIAE
jgi:molecular chaperone GrpE (heat shock protein)